jgi:group I intron endonuclease
MEEELGDIYMLTSPSGKSYIGQAKQFSGGSKHGYQYRWKQHIYEAKVNKKCSVVLDNAIRKYGHENFEVTLLGSFPLEELNFWEEHFIAFHGTVRPDGYNIMSGGNVSKHSPESIEKRRQSMMGKNKGKKFPGIRKNPEDQMLPKYLLRYSEQSKSQGYYISHHPTLKGKAFSSKLLTMEEKLQLALNYLTTADI